MAGRGILFVSLTFLFLGYFMYLPLPAGVERPWKLRFCTLITDAASSISYVVEKVSGKPFAETFHALTVLTTKPVHQNYPEIQVDNLRWDGIPVRVYKPKSLSGLSPAVVYYHGGGWVSYNIEKYELDLIQMALQANVIVVAVRYRYAPDHPYPVPFEDCVKATIYLLRSGENIGVDVKRVAVMGDSAGGNLAAAVSLRLSQEDPTSIAPIKLQVLICPALQALDFNTTSYRENSNWYLKKDLMIFFWAAYLGLDLNSETYSSMSKNAHVNPMIQRMYSSYFNKIPGTVRDKYDKKLASILDNLVIEPFVAPLMADDLSKVPPAYVIAMEFDILRDDAVMYAERLKKAGVKTDLWVFKGQSHIAGHFRNVPFGDNGDIEELYGKISEYVKKSL